MAQSRLISFSEAVTNLAVGLVLALATQMALYPGFGIRIGLWDNLKIAGSFAILSLARSYGLRRLFEALGKDRG